MKKLIVLSHPNIDSSQANRRWLKEAQRLDNEFTVHQLYEAYPAGTPLDVAAEQARLLAHDAVILQFPLYWFSTPPLLKQWLDEVLLPGFAYGRTETDRQLQGKRFGLAISAGIKHKDYRREGRYHYTIDEVLAPLYATLDYIKVERARPFVLYGIEYDPTNPALEDTSEDIEASVQPYVDYLRSV
jgi:NAD(P)H dehydrogenase (quinone)